MATDHARTPQRNDDRQHGAAAPQHAWRAAPRAAALRRDVVGADTTVGYLHTGIEKTAEQKKWQQVIPLVERMDYLGAQSNSLAFFLSTERLMGIEIACPSG